MMKYIVFKCNDCKNRVMYPSYSADGHSCKLCGSTYLIPIDEGLKSEMSLKHNLDRLVPLGIEPREVHMAKRLNELHNAIERYLSAGLGIPAARIDEYNELNEKYGKHLKL